MENSSLIVAAGFILYLLASRLALRQLRDGPREVALGLLNVCGTGLFIYVTSMNNAVLKLAVYAVVVVTQYTLLRLFAETRGWGLLLAFFMPIGALIVIRYMPASVYAALGHAFGRNLHGVPVILGISYFAFRCSRLVLEVNNGAVKKPGIWEYLGFAFFLPTMSVGPINSYANFRRGFASAPWEVPVGAAAFRFLVGLIKFRFLGGILNHVTYAEFLLNGYPHYWIDLPLVMVLYYLYLYCNFSGYCDMAIATAAFIGIPVPENFDNPFAARNIKDFWNRWHITLSQWMRDIVFAPLSKFLVRLMGPPNANHAIALAITVVFLLVGIWHGVGWNYVIFGLIHATGLVVNHYYTIGLKKWLGREGFKAYMENRWVHAAAVSLTFAYCAASLLFFANSFTELKEIFQSLR